MPQAVAAVSSTELARGFSSWASAGSAVAKRAVNKIVITDNRRIIVLRPIIEFLPGNSITGLYCQSAKGHRYRSIIETHPRLPTALTESTSTDPA